MRADKGSLPVSANPLQRIGCYTQPWQDIELCVRACVSRRGRYLQLLAQVSVFAHGYSCPRMMCVCVSHVWRERGTCIGAEPGLKSAEEVVCRAGLRLYAEWLGRETQNGLFSSSPPSCGPEPGDGSVKFPSQTSLNLSFSLFSPSLSLSIPGLKGSC